MEESNGSSSNFASPVKRLTPTVPIPRWNNEAIQVKLHLFLYYIHYYGEMIMTLSLDPNYIRHYSLQQMDIDNQVSTPNNAESASISHQNEIDTTQNRVSVINTVNVASQSSAPISVIQTPVQRPESTRSDSSASTLPRVVGDVVLTPTHSSFTPQHANPHSSLTAITPMVSGTAQAKNSIKIQ